MANHVSSLKRARQTVGKTAVNRSNKSKLRGTLRELREAIAQGIPPTGRHSWSSVRGRRGEDAGVENVEGDGTRILEEAILRLRLCRATWGGGGPLL